MRVFLGWLLATGIVLQTSAPTTLRLSFRGPNGEAVRPDRVTLLLDWWGGGERLPLPLDPSEIAVDLDPNQFKGRWPIPPNEPSRLLIEARGYATLLSEPFGWPDSQLPVTLSFRNQSVTLHQGEVKDVEVSLRHPAARSMRFVDQSGRAVAGLQVDVYMFWTRQNHCGVFEDYPIATRVTDSQGRIVVPDGDFDYGVDVFNNADVVFDREPVFYEKIVKPTGSMTTISARRFGGRSVAVQIVAPNQVVGGLQLVGTDRYTGCMDPGIRPLGVSDARGRVMLQAFSFDRFENIAICRGDTELWRAPATTLDKSVVRVTLNRTYKSADPTTDLCTSRRAP